MPLAIYSSVFAAMVVLGLALYPAVTGSVDRYLGSRSERAHFELAELFLDLSPRQLRALYLLSPIALGGIGWLMGRGPAPVIIGMIAGVVLPKFIVAYVRATRQKKFHGQFVDTILLMASSLRAGLSIQQAFTVVAEEMPSPAGQEFGLILKEMRMGVSLEDAMLHFRGRMVSDDTHLFVTAVLVVRETGGDITVVLGRLAETIRERKKIRERIKTLTFMARMQALLMSIMPVAFSYIVYTTDPSHFGFFLHDPFGRVLLVGIILTQVLVAYLLIRFSRSPIL